MSNQKLTHERLTSLIEYDPDTGMFTRKITLGAGRLGRQCGCIGSSGYLRTMVDGKSYQNHRLAWFYMTGEWPPHEVDHINFCKTDNRFSNLRCATRAENAAYKKPRQTRLGLPRGVIRSLNKFAARIMVRGKFHYLGRFETPEAAHEAYRQAAIKYHGEFRSVA
jgi:hypothetical protein